jgi:mannose-1-phosphate guanylyltransferase
MKPDLFKSVDFVFFASETENLEGIRETFSQFEGNLCLIEKTYPQEKWSYVLRISEIMTVRRYKYAFILLKNLNEKQLQRISKFKLEPHDLAEFTMIQLAPSLRKQLFILGSSGIRSLLTLTRTLHLIKIRKNFRAYLYWASKIVSKFLIFLQPFTSLDVKYSHARDSRSIQLKKYAEMRLISEVDILVVSAATLDSLSKFKAGDVLGTQEILLAISRAGYFRTFVRL